MTQLELAFSEIQKLPSIEQNEFITWILEELHSEKRWQKLFAKSENLLESLAAEAQAEYRAGKTEKLNPDTL